MKSIRLVFGTYNYYSVCSSNAVLERTYQQAYKPFLTVLNRFPKFPVVLHYSGILLEWIEKNHPEFIMLLADMAKRKQIELLTGGFYEPVLPLIPNSDKLGQIEKLTTFLRTRFGKRPRGCWLTEGIWESSLASTLNTSGIEFTFLNGSHCRYAGLGDEELSYTYLTEDQGKTLSIFPLADTTVSISPAHSAEETLSLIMSKADNSGDKILSIIDNGEKLGCDNYSRIYEGGWLKNFMELLLSKSDVIIPISPSRYMRQTAPRRKVYFPTTSYSEIMEWLFSPPNGAAAPRNRRLKSKIESKNRTGGGLFRHFLTRYPESNLMYSKMMYTHLLVNQIRGDKYRKKTAREELWKGQCHSAYWHGEFGGIYNGSLRKMAYRSFLEAEKVTRTNEAFTASIISFDFDMDGKKEYLYQGKDLNVYVHCLGGMVFEIDYLPARWNYGDTLARRPEIYHSEADKRYDWYMRKSFIDHFFSEGDTEKTFNTMSYKESGDFVTGLYELGKFNREHCKLFLGCKGTIRRHKKAYQISVEKNYNFKQNTVQVDYAITNMSNEELDLWFGTELNLAFVSTDKSDLSVVKYDKSKKSDLEAQSVTSHSEVTKLVLQDPPHHTSINLGASGEFSLWSMPVETASKSNGKTEKIYQSSCLVPHWKFRIKPDEAWTESLTLSFSSSRKRKKK